jgi:hypothetical protein
MWINQEVELPQPLITAQREGRFVVLLAPACRWDRLPTCHRSARARRLGRPGVLTLHDGEAFDVFLGRLEEHGVDVQARTRERIDVPTSLPRLVIGES